MTTGIDDQSVQSLDLDYINDINERIKQKGIRDLKEQNAQELAAFDRGELSEFYPNMTRDDLIHNQQVGWKLFYGEIKPDTPEAALRGTDTERSPTPEEQTDNLAEKHTTQNTSAPDTQTDQFSQPSTIHIPLTPSQQLANDPFHQEVIRRGQEQTKEFMRVGSNHLFPSNLTEEIINNPDQNLPDPSKQTLTQTQDGRWYVVTTTQTKEAGEGSTSRAYYINTPISKTYPKCIKRDSYPDYDKRDWLGHAVPDPDADYYDENTQRLRSRYERETIVDIPRNHTKISANPIGLLHTYFYLCANENSQTWDRTMGEKTMFERGMMFDRDNNLSKPLIRFNTLPREMFAPGEEGDTNFENYNSNFANQIAERGTLDREMGQPEETRMHTVMLHPAMGTNIPHPMLFNAEHVRDILLLNYDLEQNKTSLDTETIIADTFNDEEYQKFLQTKYKQSDPAYFELRVVHNTYMYDEETNTIVYRARKTVLDPSGNVIFPNAMKNAAHNRKRAGKIAGSTYTDPSGTKRRSYPTTFVTATGRKCQRSLSMGQLAWMLHHNELPPKRVNFVDGNALNPRKDNLTSAAVPRQRVYNYSDPNKLPRTDNKGESNERALRAATQKLYRERKKLREQGLVAEHNLGTPEQQAAEYQLRRQIWLSYGLDPDQT